MNGTDTVDWSVQVKQRRVPKRDGFFPDEEGHWHPFDEVSPALGEGVVLAAPDPGAQATPKEATGSGGEEAAGDQGTPTAETKVEAVSPSDLAVAGDVEKDKIGGIGGPEPGDEAAVVEVQHTEEPRPWMYDVVIRRSGGLRLPVVIEVIFEGSERQRFTWTREMQATSNWWRLPIEARAEKIRAVVIDPERLYFLDRDMSDNQWFAEVDASTPWRWGERVLTQYSQLFGWYASIGG